MNGFAADIAALRAAANAAASVAEQVDGVDLGECMREVPSGMAGSESAIAAQRLAEVWETRLDSWVTAVRGYGAKVSDAANRYEDNEEAADAAFAGGLLGGILPWR